MREPRDTLESKEERVAHTLGAIKANNTLLLEELYTENYHKIERLVLKNSGTREQAKDLYQEAFIAFWRNINHDKFTPKTHSSISGYLYTIAKYKWINHLRSNKHKMTVLSDDDMPFENSAIDIDPVDGDPTDDKIEKERLLNRAMAAFKDLGQPCKDLLTRFYFEKKSMKEIADELHLEPASARNKKYRCMQELRELAQKGE